MQVKYRARHADRECGDSEQRLSYRRGLLRQVRRPPGLSGGRQAATGALFSSSLLEAAAALAMLALAGGRQRTSCPGRESVEGVFEGVCVFKAF